MLPKRAHVWADCLFYPPPNCATRDICSFLKKMYVYFVPVSELCFRYDVQILNGDCLSGYNAKYFWTQVVWILTALMTWSGYYSCITIHGFLPLSCILGQVSKGWLKSFSNLLCCKCLFDFWEIHFTHKMLLTQGEQCNWELIVTQSMENDKLRRVYYDFTNSTILCHCTYAKSSTVTMRLGVENFTYLCCFWM